MKRILWIVIVQVFMFPLHAICESSMPIEIGNRGKIYARVADWKQLNQRNVVQAGFDYSCGSAALATLLNMQFGEKLTEADIIETLLQGKTQEDISKIEQNGYSLAELKKAAEAKGYNVFILKVTLEDCYKLSGPVLIYFEPDSERHFAVLKYVRGGKAYLADPSRGNIKVSLYRLRDEWGGIIFAVGK